MRGAARRKVDAGVEPRDPVAAELRFEQRQAFPRNLIALIAACVLVIVLVSAARSFAVKPLTEWDGWAIWGVKARALYEFGGAYGPVFTNYQPVTHPIFLPALEAVDYGRWACMTQPSFTCN